MEFCGFLFWTALCIMSGYWMRKMAERQSNHEREDEDEDHLLG